MERKELDGKTMPNVTDPSSKQTLIDTVLQAGSFLVIVVSAVFFNVLILIAFYKYKPLRTFTNAFVFNLACTDISLGLISEPLTLTSTITVDWVFGESMCKYHGFVNVFFSKASIWTLTFVSFERYLSIRRPFYHQRWVTPTTVSAALVFIWTLALVFACIPFGISSYTFYKFNHTCVVDWRARATLLYLFFAIILPLTLMIIFNFGILKTALDQNRKINIAVGHVQKVNVGQDAITGDPIQGNNAEEQETTKKAKKRRKKETRATILVLVIVGSFALCWLPYTVTSMCLMIKGPKCTWSPRLFVATAWFTYLNSAINPILYIAFNVTFRRAIRQVLHIRTTRSSTEQVA